MSPDLDPPTAADYAMASAREAKDALDRLCVAVGGITKRLELRITELEEWRREHERLHHE